MVMTQATTSDWAPHPSHARVAGRLTATIHRAAAGLPVLLRLPKPGDAMSDDIRRVLEEDDFAGGEDEPGDRPGAPEAGWSAGLALCIPSLALIGILYSFLK